MDPEEVVEDPEDKQVAPYKNEMPLGVNGNQIFIDMTYEFTDILTIINDFKTRIFEYIVNRHKLKSDQGAKSDQEFLNMSHI